MTWVCLTDIEHRTSSLILESREFLRAADHELMHGFYLKTVRIAPDLSLLRTGDMPQVLR